MYVYIYIYLHIYIYLYIYIYILQDSELAPLVPRLLANSDAHIDGVREMHALPFELQALDALMYTVFLCHLEVLCMYVCRCLCVYVYMYMYVCMHAYVYVGMYGYRRSLRSCILPFFTTWRCYVCMYVCAYVCMCICMYVCMCMCMYECMATGARCAHVYCFPLPPAGAVSVCMYVLMYICVYVCMYAGVCLCMVCVMYFSHTFNTVWYVYVYVWYGYVCV